MTPWEIFGTELEKMNEAGPGGILQAQHKQLKFDATQQVQSFIERGQIVKVRATNDSHLTIWTRLD